MKILHVVPGHFPTTRYGKTIYSVHGLAAGQTALGPRVSVFTTNAEDPGSNATTFKVCDANRSACMVNVELGLTTMPVPSSSPECPRRPATTACCRQMVTLPALTAQSPEMGEFGEHRDNLAILRPGRWFSKEPAWITGKTYLRKKRTAHFFSKTMSKYHNI